MTNNLLPNKDQLSNSSSDSQNLKSSTHSHSSGSEDRLNEQDQILLQEKAFKAFVPVALILVTEIENHDIFRSMLEELFESIRRPE